MPDTGSFFRGKVLRLENIGYYTIYENRRRKFIFGPRPKNLTAPRIRRSRLKIRAETQAIRNVIAIAREFEAFLARPEVYGYQQVAKHFGVSKVMVSYYLALLTRLPADFVAWLETCTEELPVAFFSLRRLRTVTILEEAKRKDALLTLAQTLVQELDGHPSQAVPVLLRLLIGELVSRQDGRELRGIETD